MENGGWKRIKDIVKVIKKVFSLKQKNALKNSPTFFLYTIEKIHKYGLKHQLEYLSQTSLQKGLRVETKERQNSQTAASDPWSCKETYLGPLQGGGCLEI